MWFSLKRIELNIVTYHVCWCSEQKRVISQLQAFNSGFRWYSPVLSYDGLNFVKQIVPLIR